MGVEYDFYITENGRFVVPEYDIDFLFSLSESDVPELAETEETSVKISGRDGDVVLNTTYKPKEFKLVVYTSDNLSPQEKENEKSKVNRFLNSIKNDFKKIAFLQKGIMYEVKYFSQLVLSNYPKSIRFEIPLKSSQSLGMALEKKVIEGAATAESNTIEEAGCIITIFGPAQTPVIALNDYQMEYDNVILDGNKLVIDTGNSTITHITSQGVETNAAIYYNHEYPRIQPGINEVKIYSGIEDNSQVITEWYDLKL